MLSLSRLRTLMLVCALLVSPIAVGSSRGQGAGSTDVSFKSFDGVTLSGKLYAGAPGGKKDGTVLLIPHFSLTKGGGMQQQGYDDLAKSLQKEGYTVLSFDFRGFGDSKAVDPVNYWKHPFNMNYRTKKPKVSAGGKFPEQIDHKDFRGSYTEYFVNDIAAAKAFLDAENDSKNCNTSNLVVVGAGYGASLGAMWVANECRRRRDLSVLPGAAPQLGDLESDSIVGTVWLSISPSLPGVKQFPLRRWIVEGGRTHKIPMAFICGENDTEGAKYAASLKASIAEGAAKKDYADTYFYEVPKTKLTGAKLLDANLDTESRIIKYLDQIMGKRGKKRRTDKKVETSRFFYTRSNGMLFKPNKRDSVQVPSVDTAFLQLPAP